jgi:hypothetical protein
MIDTKPQLDTAEDLLAALLTGTVDALELPAELAAAAEVRYKQVGDHLNSHGDALGGAAWDVYPQGSVILGTTISPLDPKMGYDIDSVCVRDIEKESITRSKLKTDTGTALGQYVRTYPGITIKEGKRCWTLDFGDFHMDVLPAIPNPEGSETGILITDQRFAEWLSSDPKAYARWFRGVMSKEWLERRKFLAEKRRSTVEDVPEFMVKTALQRGVMVLKRHCDIYFQKHLDRRPPSILITTLAANAYTADQNLYQVVLTMAENMTAHIGRDGATYVVLNPVQTKENFADKWAIEPWRKQDFFNWVEALKRDFAEIGRLQRQGIPVLKDRLASLFGEGPVVKAVESWADTVRNAGDSGSLRAAVGTGALTTALNVGHKVRPHTFYGEELKD